MKKNKGWYFLMKSDFQTSRRNFKKIFVICALLFVAYISIMIIYNNTGVRRVIKDIKYNNNWITEIIYDKKSNTINIYSSDFSQMEDADKLDTIQEISNKITFNKRGDYAYYYNIISDKKTYTYNLNIDDDDFIYDLYCDGKIYYEGKNFRYTSSDTDYFSSDSALDSGKGGKEKDAWVYAQKVVEINLKSPSSADFPWYDESYVTYLGDDRYMINSYVEADNSYGVHIKSNFIVTLTLTENGFTDYDCVID